MDDLRYDVIVIGGGVAGLTAGLYACRAGLKTVLLERMMTGGQIINTDAIENFPGFPENISGANFTAVLQDQAVRDGLEIRLSEVTGFQSLDRGWMVETYDGDLQSKTVIIAVGSQLRTLDVLGEKELHGAGVSYCATCDGAFFADQVVAVIGGGDSAVDEANVLTRFASKVIVINRNDRLTAQKILRDRAVNNSKIEVRHNTIVTSILGENQVEAVSIKNIESGETSEIPLAGVFIYVGLRPNSELLEDLLDLDNSGHVPTDIWMQTDLPGLLAAGDIRQHSASQLVAAAGDGATAAIAAHRYIDSQNWLV